MEMFKAEPYPEQTITIVCPYRAQCDLHLSTRQMLHKKTGLPYEKLLQVATIDSMQGHESGSAILDLVTDRNGKLGFLVDDRRINVAVTRARASLTVVWRSDLDVQPDTKANEQTEVVQLWDYLRSRDAITDLDPPKHESNTEEATSSDPTVETDATGGWYMEGEESEKPKDEFHW